MLKCICTDVSKEPYILSKEPYILSKEPYILSKEPYLLSKEPCILSKEPYILSKEPYILSEEPYILSKEPYRQALILASTYVDILQSQICQSSYTLNLAGRWLSTRTAKEPYISAKEP